MFWVFNIVACSSSDQCALVSSIHVPQVPSPVPGVWKLNLYLLWTTPTLISNFWSDWRYMQPRFPILIKWWDKGKSIIKRLSIIHCCDRSSRWSQHRNLLSRLADHLKRRKNASIAGHVQFFESSWSESNHRDPSGDKVEYPSQLCNNNDNNNDNKSSFI